MATLKHKNTSAGGSALANTSGTLAKVFPMSNNERWTPSPKNWKQVYALEDSTLFHELNYKEYKVFSMIRHHGHNPKHNRNAQLNPRGSCWLDQRQLGDACNMSERSIRDAIRGLERKQKLRVHRTPGRNQYHKWDCTCLRCDRQRMKNGEHIGERGVQICHVCTKIIPDPTQTHISHKPKDTCSCYTKPPRSFPCI